MKQNKIQLLFLSHGGGPMPLLGDKSHDEMVSTLQHISSSIKKPTAILVISAHWENETATITSGATPPLIYDYYGFPPQSYEITYPCVGEPKLAQQIAAVLHDNGVKSKLDSQQGFDHGVFVPLKIMYPKADIPCVQLSLLNSLDPATHINIGRALADLGHEDLLIIGSGFSFHNMKAFFENESDTIQAKNHDFESWLIDTCSNSDMDETQRANKLINWEKAPYARFCHPREEHLLPLHVCYGVAEKACDKYFELTIFNKKASMFLWNS